MKAILFSLISVSISAFAFSQISFIPGYIVNAKKDTLKGEVKINPKKEHENHLKVFFKDESGAQKNYKPEKTLAYGYGDNHYVSIAEGDEASFYKRLTNGHIILYKTAFEVINKNVSSFDFEYYLYKEGDKKLTPLKEGKFKKQMHEWMVGSPEIADEFFEEKKFNVESAIEVINKYNEWKKQH
jgi:hypothetical protein